MAEKGKGRSLKDRLVDMGVLVEKDESPSAAQGSAAVSGPGGLPGPGSVAGGVDRDLLKQLLAAATKDTNDYTEFMLSADAMSGSFPTRQPASRPRSLLPSRTVSPSKGSLPGSPAANGCSRRSAANSKEYCRRRLTPSSHRSRSKRTTTAGRSTRRSRS